MMGRDIAKRRRGEFDRGISQRVLEKLLCEAACVNDGALEGVGATVAEMVAAFGPRDAAERMLVVQMVATHAQVLFLARHANGQKNARWFGLFQGELSKAMELYRKQMLALAEYRRPRRQIFTAIRTANIAAQQVVAGLGRKRKRLTAGGGRVLESTSVGVPGVGGASSAEAEVSIEPGGAGGAGGGGSEESALDEKHRAADGSGEGGGLRK